MWVPDLSPMHRIEASLIPRFIPPPLRSIYEIAGNWPVPFTEQWRRPNWTPGLFGTQDQLLPMDKLKANGERFTFLHENQVWSCETLFDKEDPPVYSDSLAFEGGDDNMREVCSSLSHFLTTFCLQELAFGSRNLFCIDSEIRAPEDLVTGDLESVWVKGVYVFKEPTHSFYLCDSRLIVMDTGGGYWIAYNEAASSELVNKSLKIRRIH